MLAAGAYLDDEQDSDSGSLHVWSNNEQFTYVQKFLAPDAGPGDGLDSGGASLSADGRVLAAGAHLDGDNGDKAGSLYVWELD